MRVFWKLLSSMALVLCVAAGVRGQQAPDWDGNGQIQPADINGYVNAWTAALVAGTVPPAVDVDHNGRIEPADISLFVSTWQSALVNPPVDTGWTNLTPPAGANVIYVSSSTGNDANTGLNSAQPKRTINSAYNSASYRNGSADQILLKRGDTWNESVTLTKTGASATARLLIGAYGTGARPVIVPTGGDANGFNRGCGQSNGNLIIADIEVRASTSNEYNGGPGSGSGIVWFCGPAFSGKNILIEGCKFTRLFRGMELQDCENLVIRRNVFEDICSRVGAGYSPSSTYVGLTRNITIEENFIVTKAFTTVRVPYQQDTNVYIQDENEGTIIVRKNIITSKGGQGPQGIGIRSPATVSDNFMDGCHTGIHVGGQDTPPSGRYPNGTHYTVTGNVVTRLVNMTNVAGGERGIGIQYAYFDTTGSLIADNIISNKTVNTDGTGLNSDPTYYSGGTRNATIRNNILYNANGIQFQRGSSSASFNNIITNNEVQNPGSASAENALTNPFAASVGTWSQNKYFSSRAAGTWFQIDYANRTNNQWLTIEPTATFAAITYPNPTRTLQSYGTSLGLANNWDAVANKLLAQSRTNWDTNYTHSAIIQYFKAGFGR